MRYLWGGKAVEYTDADFQLVAGTTQIAGNTAQSVYPVPFAPFTHGFLYVQLTPVVLFDATFNISGCGMTSDGVNMAPTGVAASQKIFTADIAIPSTKIYGISLAWDCLGNGNIYAHEIADDPGATINQFSNPWLAAPYLNFQLENTSANALTISLLRISLRM